MLMPAQQSELERHTMSCKGKLKTSHDRQTKLMFKLTEQPGRKQEVQEQGCQGRSCSRKSRCSLKGAFLQEAGTGWG